MDLQAKLRARREAWTDEEDVLPVPGYGDELYARYKDTSWSTFRAVAGNAALNALGTAVPAAKEVEAAAKMLLEANVGMEAHVDGQVAPILHDGVPVKMGLSLAAFLGIEGAETDQQAIHLIFHREKDLMSHAMALVAVQEGREDEAEGSIRGN